MGLKDFFKINNSYDNKFPIIFHSSNWKKATYDEKVKAFQSLENYDAKNQNRLPRNVIPTTLKKNEYGYFNPRDGNIYFNSKFLKNNQSKFRYHAMDTIVHEGRHAYQDDIVRKKIPNTKSEPEKLWTMNRIAYFGSSKNYSLYRFQPIEIDSNKYAHKEITKLNSSIENKLGKDKHFKQYDKDIKYNLKLSEKEAIKKYGKDYEKVIQNKVEDMYKDITKNKTIKNDRKIASNRMSLDDRIKQIKNQDKKNISNKNKTFKNDKEISNKKPSLNEKIEQLNSKNETFSKNIEIDKSKINKDVKR